MRRRSLKIGRRAGIATRPRARRGERAPGCGSAMFAGRYRSMRRIRSWWAAFLMAPAALVTHASSAKAEEALPKGVHLGIDGHYTVDVCDHDAAYHCFMQRQLPETWH